ncbi:P-loop containing nucleoside triphosphate hydrolase protein [Auricularia subglabra TFB-10046 SS5]|nr:P-loop containing nucleoside triphosphate hydrolase protein [Auricularia subglabra TFB-10046 SS5]
MGFWRQFWALFKKNWIVLGKHWFLNVLRCFVLLVAFGVFLGVAQLFLIKPSNLGLGTIVPVKPLADAFDPSFKLIWAINGTSADEPANVTPAAIMDRVTQDFSDRQLRSVRQLENVSDVAAQCPQNFQLYSECYAAIVFEPSTAGNYSYTLRGDAGFFFVDVQRHTSDFERRVLPLQSAIDRAIIELATGKTPPVVQEWPFTQETNANQKLRIRLSFVRGFRSLLVLGFFACFLGIVYHLPGAATTERASGVTQHMKVMGLKDAARIISWHVSISLAYLPAWVIVAIVWKVQIFAKTNVGLVIAIHLITGLSLASWSLLVAVRFGKSPQLAAVFATFFALLFAILAVVLRNVATGVATIFTLIFPPSFFIFATRAIAGWENNELPTDALHADPDKGIVLLPILIAGIIDIFLFPWLAAVAERRIYDAHEPPTRTSWFRRRKALALAPSEQPDTSMAISVRGLRKDFGAFTAVADLSLDVPRGALFVLLGSNGAGKSTSLSIIAGLLSRTAGALFVADKGKVGIVPQKNVLFPELTCVQTLRVWRDVKGGSESEEDLRQLLRDCDLGPKEDANADTLSGGQKRKLQLAIGLVGGSSTVLVDECTSGVDPLSRRAIWRTLTRVRGERTVVFTTHFLDEADLLGDHVAILAPPGKLVASAHPVALKARLGGGYTAHVSFDSPSQAPDALLGQIRALAAEASVESSPTADVAYRLGTGDNAVVGRVLQLLQGEGRHKYGVHSYDVAGPTLEDVFLALMRKEEQEHRASADGAEKHAVNDSASVSMDGHAHTMKALAPLALTDGRRISPLHQAAVIFRKRLLILRRSWLTPVLAILIAICGCCIPLFFLTSQKKQCGVREARNLNVTAFRPVPLFLPESPYALMGLVPGLQVPGNTILVAPPDLPSELGAAAAALPYVTFENTAALEQAVRERYTNLSTGAIAYDAATGQAVFAWEAMVGTTGTVLNNFASNVILNALGADGQQAVIRAQYAPFTGIGGGPLAALRWLAFFGAALSVFPAFFALYVSRERRTLVQAMQHSNGLSNPAGLWLGHLLFDAIPGVIVATVVTIIFATVVDQFHGLGYLWLVMFLYAFVGVLFSYLFVLLTTSPLAAFAAVAGYQFILFVLYLSAYLLTYTYAKNSKAPSILNYTHYFASFLSPVCSVLRAIFVSINLFNLLCSGNGVLDVHSLGTIPKFGGPILYLIVSGLVFFGILVAIDSGVRFPLRVGKRGSSTGATADASESVPSDVQQETQAAAASDAPLRILHVTKQFNRGMPPQVDDVSFAVGQDTVFSLLGPNGAGKTTTFNIIRGEVVPDSGEIHVAGFGLGVCPQFTAIDAQLTVRQHLEIYGQLKGLSRGVLAQNVDTMLKATTLAPYADRLAGKLSGGNGRKLALAIALMGNPSVVLIDEFSTGIDPATKRTMWDTFRRVAVGKAVVITTHSMEEAAALSNKVGIIARKMLAIGTTDSLSSRFQIYEVHVSCRTADEVQRAREILAHVPGSRPADDVATRFEVPIGAEGGMSLADLFELLSSQGGEQFEYAVERTSLESVFLKVIRANNVKEEDAVRTRSGFKWFRKMV